MEPTESITGGKARKKHTESVDWFNAGKTEGEHMDEVSDLQQ